jgi:hypothetical protein
VRPRRRSRSRSRIITEASKAAKMMPMRAPLERPPEAPVVAGTGVTGEVVDERVVIGIGPVVNEDAGVVDGDNDEGIADGGVDVVGITDGDGVADADGKGEGEGEGEGVGVASDNAGEVRPP